MKPHKFFIQDLETLTWKWHNLVKPILKDFGFSKEFIKLYKEAYFYFCQNPTEYDGATIVHDRYNIDGLDLPSMLHDYLYIIWNTLRGRLKADLIYANHMRRFHYQWWVAWGRFVLLYFINLTGIYKLFQIFKKLKNGTTTTRHD